MGQLLPSPSEQRGGDALLAPSPLLLAWPFDSDGRRRGITPPDAPLAVTTAKTKQWRSNRVEISVTSRRS